MSSAIPSPYTPGQLINYQVFTNSVLSTLAGAPSIIPFDNTPPLSTEGMLIVSGSYSPKSSSSIIEIQVQFFYSTNNGNIQMTVSTFDGGTLLKPFQTFYNVSGTGDQFIGIHNFNNASLVARSLSARFGGNVAATLTLNGTGGANVYGGPQTSSLIVREYLI
jgi:hypothetical protein